MAKLLVQEGNGSREFELVDLEASIGRELDNSLRLPDPSISRHHAVIRQANGGFEIQDLGSSNGVLVNGTRMETALLKDGDRVTLGQVQLTYLDPRATKENPLGTVRLNLDDMAKLQARGGTDGGVPHPEAPVPTPAPVAAVPAPVPPPAAGAAQQPPRIAPLRPAPSLAPEMQTSGLGSLLRWFGDKFRRS
jgi:hypothetical protein